MSLLTQVNKQYYYGPNNRYRALDALGSLTTTFKNRFRQGAVTQLPPGFLYNTVTKRFYSNTSKNRERFKNLNNIDGVLQPASIFDYDLTKIDYRTIVQKYVSPAKQRKSGPAEIIGKTALQGFTGVKAYKNENRTGFDSINTVGKVIPFLKEQQLPIKIYVTIYGCVDRRVSLVLLGAPRYLLPPPQSRRSSTCPHLVAPRIYTLQD